MLPGEADPETATLLKEFGDGADVQTTVVPGMIQASDETAILVTPTVKRICHGAACRINRLALPRLNGRHRRSNLLKIVRMLTGGEVVAMRGR